MLFRSIWLVLASIGKQNSFALIPSLCIMNASRSLGVVVEMCIRDRAYIDPAIPRANFKIDSVEELAEHFVMWEYAVAMCGYLMKVCPFDQPDVASAKAAVLDILHEGQPACDFVQDFVDGVHMGEAEVRLSP